MHYQNKAFSKNGKPTIQLVGGSTSNEIGQRRGMSNEDFVQLNRLYHCQGNRSFKLSIIVNAN